MSGDAPGFTLIELLIVVAIIAILAAIAIPNFIEAQVRSKVSRTHSDLRTLAVAIEAYAADDNMYPPTPQTAGVYRYARLTRLTTPIAYITTIPLDPFFAGDWTVLPGEYGYPYRDPDFTDGEKASPTGRYQYLPDERVRKGRWNLLGAGPDRVYGPGSTINKLIHYDPTNGTVSWGDMLRFGP
ncbi:prepilin-type N-terminal cleavage/methylation domain-containing protein [Candidatus Sumerlaeota bacterium]|nr:prepilin-type N-terminal cleavage/methylation domain-containing protein [Candidatus Sumerlaeota bacterium]